MLRVGSLVGVGMSLVVALGAASCKRGARDAGEGTSSSAATSNGVSGASGLASPGAVASIFSAPIAGAEVGDGDAIAVGLVVASQAIVAARVDGEGRARWTQVAIPGATYSQDAEVHAWPVRAGAVVVWRGPVNGKSAHVRVTIAPDGKILDGPADVGSLVCATDEGLAWSEGPGGKTRVKLRTWGEGGAHDEQSEPIADDVSLACGAHRAYAVIEGDEGTATRVVAVGPGAPPPATLAPESLGRDEERDLFPWAAGDDFGLVRVSMAGALTAVGLANGVATPLRAERARVPTEDDVVAIDADPRAVVLVTTHDESDACPEGRGGVSVHATRIPRREGSPTTKKLAPAACGTDAGPFWTEPLGDALLVGWAERASSGKKDGKDKAAPIAALDWRLLGGETRGDAREGRVVRPADAMADAGCDARRCYAVALARPSGADGMTPEPIVVVAYP